VLPQGGAPMWTLLLTILLDPAPGHPSAFVVHAYAVDFYSRAGCEAAVLDLRASDIEGGTIVQTDCVPIRSDV
jgi:hypothetical protein